MAGYKETPRQKMIGMLYLVLTALLALNVSKDILNAFLVVNDNMENSNQSFNSKINSEYAKFESQYQLNPGKTQEYWDKALQVRVKSFEMMQYIESIKQEVVARSEKVSIEEARKQFFTVQQNPNPLKPGTTYDKYTVNLNNVATKDKFDVPTNYMIGQNKNGKAFELSAKLKEYRKFILGVIGEQFADKVGMVTDGKYVDASGSSQNWETYNFYNTILAANVTILNKIIAEIQTAEFDAINNLYANISEKDFKFDHVEAKVIPKSQYVLAGTEYEAEIMVAAFDSKSPSTVKIVRGVDKVSEGSLTGAQVLKTVDGTAKLQFAASAPGPQRYAGIIEMVDPSTNELARYSFAADYIVVPRTLTVAPLKMNILYSGLKNPVSINAPGVPSELITPSISKGKMTKREDGTYDVEVPTGEKTVTITAVARIGENTMDLGSFLFRIKRVPDPVAKIANMTDGQIEKNRLIGARAIIPELVDFDFADFNYEIVSYQMSTYRGGDLQTTGTIKGNVFNETAMNFIKNAAKGQKLYFERIQAKGPDGTMRTLNPINLEIN
jgi:gliding motility-associated protein GldM